MDDRLTRQERVERHYLETPYETLLRIHKLTYAAEMLADNCPILMEPGAPPILFLLEETNQELYKLQQRLSD